MIRASLAAGLLALSGLVLAGCGSQTQISPSARIAQTVATSVAGTRGAAPRVDLSPSRLTRAQIASITVPADLVTLEKAGVSAVVVRTGLNGGVETWSSPDDRTISVRDGVIVATRGLGADLMAARVPGVAQLAAGGSWERLHTTLNGEDQAVITRYSCTASSAGPARIVVVERAYETRLVRESCEGGGTRFVNEYWLQGGAKLRQSRQWIGHTVGYVAIRRLSD
ncbi:MAG: YjbF family lipoprotein [Paracoccaceae bacterium]|nr:MAG: YjbF family lipoprotein [Paracoccaceae bacterium]